jgi:hypothetical protein
MIRVPNFFFLKIKKLTLEGKILYIIIIIQSALSENLKIKIKVFHGNDVNSKYE